MVRAQNTVGLLAYNATKSIEGYNLIYPNNQSTTYLLNACGEIVHRWDDTDEDARPGNVAYLLPNGSLLRAKNYTPLFESPSLGLGGSGGVVQLISWDNEIEWTYVVADSTERQHHDVHPLPNGNILILSYELVDSTTMAINGFDFTNTNIREIWSEKIIEVDPLTDSLHWEWRLWDHLVQDVDELKLNFGDISLSSERINLNFIPPNGLSLDWIHANALDYNAALDQIMISARNFNEIWIIDHSTSTAEAASNTGGNSGRGGDLLWRWGAPAAYDQGGPEDQKLYWNHDAQWVDDFISPESEYYGAVAVFNNYIDYDTQNGRSLGQIIRPVWDENNKSYVMQDNVFLPLDFSATFSHPDSAKNFSTTGSSIQMMDNGHVIMCAARQGRSFELDEEGEVVWEYLTPLRNGIAFPQGSTLNLLDNFTFQLKRYPIDYPAFLGRDLSPQGFIETEPNEAFCLSVNNEEPRDKVATLNVFPNPASSLIQLTTEQDYLPLELYVHDSYGRLLEQLSLNKAVTELDATNWPKGLYTLQIPALRLVRRVIVQ